eukprot:1938198-Rhodomonas_salina.1
MALPAMMGPMVQVNASAIADVCSAVKGVGVCRRTCTRSANTSLDAGRPMRVPDCSALSVGA